MEEEKWTEGRKKTHNFLYSHNLLLPDRSLSLNSHSSPIANREYCIIVEQECTRDLFVQCYCKQI